MPDDTTPVPIEVVSMYGAKTRRGLVALTIDGERTIMDPKKAQEVGLMLIECAEAAVSDEAFVRFICKLVGTDELNAARMLVDLRVVRQGTRDTVWPH